MSVDAIRACRSAARTAADRVNFPYSHFVWDGLALRLSAVFARAGVGANTVTLLNYVLLLTALVVIASRALGPSSVLVGGVLLHGVLIFDNVDGHLARYRGATSLWGAAFDSLLTWMQFSLLPVCLVFAVLDAQPEPWLATLGLALPAWVWWAAAVARSIGYLLTVVVTEHSQHALGVGGYEQRVEARSVPALMLVKAIVEAEALLLIVGSLLSMVGLVHLGYAVLHLLILGLVLVRNARDLRARDRELLRRDEPDPSRNELR